MKRLIIIIIAAGLALAGCQNQHEVSKQQALKRWNQARSHLAVNLARQQFQAGQLKKSEQSLMDVLEKSPDSAEAWMLLAKVYQRQNRPSQSRRCLDKTLELSPDDPEANFYIAITYENSGDLAKALECYQQAWASNIDYVPYMISTVEVMVALDKKAEALKLLQEQIELGQTDPAVHYVAGNILASMGRPEAAASMYSEARKRFPKDVQVTEALAFTLMKSGKIDEAIKLFERLNELSKVKKESSNKSIILALGDCYIESGEFHQAQRCFEEAARQDASNPAIWRRLAQTALGRGDLSRARSYAGKALILEKDNNDALTVMAYIMMKENDYDGAHEIIENIIAIDQKNSLAYCMLGQTYEARGYPSKAANCYAQALQIDPQDRLAGKLMTSVEVTQLSDARESSEF